MQMLNKGTSRLISLRNIAVIAATLAFLLPVRAQDGYEPDRRVRGTLRVWGSAQMQELMRLWEAGFRQFQPEVRFEEKLNGTVSAMGGLYAGAADLALMGRDIWPEEAMAYKQTTGATPTGVDVAMGSFDVPTKADALMIFVNRDNPLSSIRFDQLAHLFECGDTGSPKWSDAGVAGQMGSEPAHLYGYLPENAASRFFRARVLHGPGWNCGYRGFGNLEQTGKPRIDAGRQIIEALSTDPLGIAIANIHYATPQVKVLALSEGPGLPYVVADRSDYIAGRYPLTRTVSIYINCSPAHGGCSPAALEFLRYVLSRQGQQDVSREGAYQPLAATHLAAEWRKLDTMR
ncbi:MAG TPA: substrate-binding domain-containing protein [Terracidiphilus sp.]|nr:substrate-binding domain-containing protein [Terracidiphilus sp.]